MDSIETFIYEQDCGEVRDLGILISGSRIFYLIERSPEIKFNLVTDNVLTFL